MWRCVKGSGRAKEKTENGWFTLDAKRCTGSILAKGTMGVRKVTGGGRGKWAYMISHISNAFGLKF